MSRVDRLLTRPVTLLEPVAASSDDYGQPVVAVTEHATLCHYRRVTSDDTAGVGTVVREDIEVFLAHDEPVESTWGVQLGDAVYEIVGEVNDAWNARLAQVEYRSVLCRRSST